MSQTINHTDRQTRLHSTDARVRLLTAFGETLSLSEWAAKIGIRPGTLSQRLTRMSLERAISLAYSPQLGPLTKENIASHVTVNKISGCWEWNKSLRTTGYGCKSVNGRPRQAHRVAYEALVGPVPRNLEVCHKCDNRLCVNPDHLFLGTRLENMMDCIAKGRHRPRRGESSPFNKLREVEVVKIRELHATGIAYRRLAEMFGVGKTTIEHIVTRKKWAWLT